MMAICYDYRIILLNMWFLLECSEVGSVPKYTCELQLYHGKTPPKWKGTMLDCIEIFWLNDKDIYVREKAVNSDWCWTAMSSECVADGQVHSSNGQYFVNRTMRENWQGTGFECKIDVNHDTSENYVMVWKCDAELRDASKYNYVLKFATPYNDGTCGDATRGSTVNKALVTIAILSHLVALLTMC